MTRPYSPTDPSSVYYRHRCTTTRHWAANQPILRIRQTGYQHRHRHITGRHEKGSKYSAEFIFPKSRYGTIKDIWKKSAQRFFCSVGFAFCLTYGKETRPHQDMQMLSRPFFSLSLLPKRPNMQRLSPLSDRVSISHHTFLHPPSASSPLLLAN